MTLTSPRGHVRTLETQAINRLWRATCRSEAEKAARARRHPASEQLTLLRSIVEANAETDFGRTHDFGSCTTYRRFAGAVPIGDYASFEAHIARVAGGASNVLTADPVRLLEPTSGSTTGRKLIPYTATMKALVQRTVAAWIWDLYRNRPAVTKGRAYWSVSPAFGEPEVTSGGLTIGFEDDTEYLGSVTRRLAGRVLAAPSDLARCTSIEDFRARTLAHLLSCGDLSLISVWSPTFLSTMLEQLDDPNPTLEALAAIDGRRAKEIETILETHGERDEKLRRVWPQLALISCWTDASAGAYVEPIRRLFPDVEIQPKGLLSTEAFVSFPLINQPGGVLAIRSHVFEFVPEDDAEGVLGSATPCLLPHQLETGRRYVPVVTNGGGLYRYLTGDVIEVIGAVDRCPLIRLVGRRGTGCDLVGEKLSESHVRAAVEATFGSAQVSVLAVPIQGPPARYRFLVSGCGRDSAGADCLELGRQLSLGLSANPYYRHARAVGQLGPEEVEVLPEGSVWARYEQACAATGMKLGDIKPTLLCSHPDVAAAVVGTQAAPTAEASHVYP